MEMHKECRGCKAIDECPVICQYGSTICFLKQMQSGQTKEDRIKRQEEMDSATLTKED